MLLCLSAEQMWCDLQQGKPALTLSEPSPGVYSCQGDRGVTSPCFLLPCSSWMRHSREWTGCVSSVASPRLFCASLLLMVASGTEQVPLPKMHVFTAPTVLSIKKQNTCQVTGATGLVCPLTCEGWHSGPWQLLVLLLLLCLPPPAVIPPLLSTWDVHRTCCMCHRDDSDTPTASHFQPEICTWLHKQADVHQQMCVYALWVRCLSSESLFPLNYILSEGYRWEIHYGFLPLRCWNQGIQKLCPELIKLESWTFALQPGRGLGVVYSTLKGEAEAWEELLLTVLIGNVGRDLVIKISCGLPK